MFFGIKMTPASAQTLRLVEVPQQHSVCVPADLWDAFDVETAPPVERSIYVMQLLSDLREYVTNGTNEWPLDIDGIAMKYGLVDALLDPRGKRIPEGDVLLNWLNIELRLQKPPVFAVRADGKSISVALGDEPPKYGALRVHRTSIFNSGFASHDDARTEAKKRLGWKDHWESADAPGRWIQEPVKWAQ